MRGTRIAYCVAAVLLTGLLVLGSAGDRLDRLWGEEDGASHYALESYSGSYDGRVAAARQPAAEDTAAPAAVYPVPLAGAAITLRPGTYRVELDYDADQPGNFAVVTVPNSRVPLSDTVNALTLPATARQMLEPGWGRRAVFTFTADETLYNAHIVACYGGGGFFYVRTLRLVAETPFSLYYTDHLLLALAFLLAAAFGYWWLFSAGRRLGQGPGERLKRLLPALFALGLAVLASYPLFASHLPMGHDMRFHLARIESVAAAFAEGQFPPRLYTQMAGGLGYAAGVFYPDVFLWPAGLLRLAGVSLLGCYQALLFAANLATAALSLYVGRRLFSSGWAGGVFCILYTLSLYRANNLYNRAALGETLAMVFLPLVFLGLYEVVKGRHSRWPLLTVGCLGVLLSNIVSAVMTALFMLPALVVAAVLLRRQWRRLAALLKAGALALLLGLFFIVPFVGLGAAVQPGQPVEMAKAAVHPAQLFTLFGGAGDSLLANTTAREMPLGPGVVLLGCGAALGVALLLGGRATRPTRRLGVLCLSLGLVALLLCTTLFPWQLVDEAPVLGGFFANLQFPWRFLSFATLFLALCGGLLASLYSPRPRHLALVLAGVLAASALSPAYLVDDLLRTQPRGAFDRFSPLDRYAVMDGNSTYFVPELRDGVAYGLLQAPLWPASAAAGFYAGQMQEYGTTLWFSYTADEASWVDVPRAWYPGYRATDQQGNTVAITCSPQGLVRLHPTTAQGRIMVEYKGPWFLWVGDIASLLGLVGCAGYGVYVGITGRRRRKAAGT